MSTKWIAAFLVLMSISATAQVKSISGGSGKLVTRRTTAPTSTSASPALSNQDVLDMVTMGLADDIVIQKIQSAPATLFDTSVPALKALKAAKVSDNIVRVMLNPHAPVATSTTTPAPSETSLLPKEVGVYVLTKDRLTEVDPEIVGWQTGGVLKQLGTLGLDKGHVNGKIMKSRSALRVSNPVEFLIRTPEGTSVTEYQLLRLYEKGNRREFRAITGGIFHATGGAERTAIEFKWEKVGERTWKIHFENLERGEYGFLPPGINSASISSSGKMYTFGVKE